MKELWLRQVLRNLKKIQQQGKIDEGSQLLLATSIAKLEFIQKEK